MNKILIMFIAFLLVACKSTSQNEVDFTTKEVDLPLKIFYRGGVKDSVYINLCFPKKIIYNNKTSISNDLSRYNLNQKPVGINDRYYPTYKFEDSLVYAKGFEIKAGKKDSLNIYYGYRLKESKLKLDSLLNDKTPVQMKSDWLVYDLPITAELKEWALSVVTDNMMKAQLHFKLHNKKQGFYYKSLIVRLFKD